MRKAAGLAVGAAAFVFLAVLAFHGQRPDPGSEFKVAGVMAATEPRLVREVVIAGRDGERRLTRGSPEWQAAEAAIERGLRFLHVTAAERVMAEQEVAAVPARDFGLDPPHLTVSLRGGMGSILAIAFGGPTPLGLSRYARVTGRAGIVILPAYVAEAWEQVGGAR